MVEAPAQYRWSSHRANAQGVADRSLGYRHRDIWAFRIDDKRLFGW